MHSQMEKEDEDWSNEKLRGKYIKNLWKSNRRHNKVNEILKLTQIFIL